MDTSGGKRKAGRPTRALSVMVHEDKKGIEKSGEKIRQIAHGRVEWEQFVDV